jgi:uncharacterized protein (DUF488 family)
LSAKQLFTIGYEGAELADFLVTLAACGITQIIDVRDVPVSRKRGFSKNVLAEALAAKGIAYIHLKDLGDPKPGREAARRGDYSLFSTIYAAHLKTDAAQAALTVAANEAGQRVSCLLCFERAHEHCHRNMVAVALAQSAGFSIRHVGVKKNISVGRGGRYGHSNEPEFAFG